ncbi:tRNA-dihydrouridine(20) synthase [NAD(P)+]-like [Dysidea avara]|uniref:tRNA-dihydrouridine(20) synthase [NAD(P)+]-like n=1 Tax=Dysidea avara TaxID=196820 RepID=UPI003328E87A
MSRDMSVVCYSNKLILAPMVRIGTLPMRLLALRYGADLVYCEEIIDHKILTCKRITNPVLDTIDYVDPSGRCVFRTTAVEKDRLVFQMGTSDAERAAKVAQFVKDDVAAVDVNMGCPKEFSLKGGMGAALLTQSDKIKQILTRLVEESTIPVTCKIRILPELQDTLDLVKLIASTGVKAIAVHGRTRLERSSQPVHYDVIKEVVKMIKIPVIANGGSLNINTYDDLTAFKSATGCQSVMIARAAQWNPSIFRKEGLLPVDQVARDYLQLAVDYDNYASNTKYCLAQLLHDQLETELGQSLMKARTMRELCDVWNMGSYLSEVEEKRKQAISSLSLQQQKELGLIQFDGHAPAAKRVRLDPDITEDGTHEFHIQYNNKEYKNRSGETPKSILHEWTKKRTGSIKYETREKAKLFKSIVTIEDKRYSSSFWSKSKKFAEQAAAEVAIMCLDIPR